MGHVCRVCHKTFSKSRENPTFCSILVDIKRLETECVEIEMDLHDSFNSFCFVCRHISMSVPDASTDEQICYLQSQVGCFKQLSYFGLVKEEE
jgi:hypothetical protein